jgi:hypothetical protein
MPRILQRTCGQNEEARLAFKFSSLNLSIWERRQLISETSGMKDNGSLGTLVLRPVGHTLTSPRTCNAFTAKADFVTHCHPE